MKKFNSTNTNRWPHLFLISHKLLFTTNYLLQYNKLKRLVSLIYFGLIYYTALMQMIRISLETLTNDIALVFGSVSEFI